MRLENKLGNQNSKKYKEVCLNENWKFIRKTGKRVVMLIANNMRGGEKMLPLGVSLPRVVRVRQVVEAPRLEKSIDDVIFAELDKINLRSQIKPGARIAITCGSRRFDNYPQIIRAIVRAVRSYGGEPFLIPAMGSHGGGTAVGQKSFLTGLGITEDYVGAKIESSLEVEKLGETKGGIPVYADKLAVNADGIIVVNRVKPHTEYDGVIESGLHKMLAIGVGKWKGAMTVHAYAFRKGYEETIIKVEYMIKIYQLYVG